MIDEPMLRKMMPNAGSRLDAHIPYIIEAMDEGNIKTPSRVAAFLAQLAHESGEYRFMQEIWGPTDAQLGYEGRADLGNYKQGDGRRFAGHGPIQITGRANHKACGEALGLDLISEPLLITMPEHGTRAAVWFWNRHNLSKLADVDWFKTITRFINGGYNGLADRRQYWDRNRALLGLPYVDTDREVAAIKDFQRACGLAADGIVGSITLAML
jgi:putative chitinase